MSKTAQRRTTPRCTECAKMLTPEQIEAVFANTAVMNEKAKSFGGMQIKLKPNLTYRNVFNGNEYCMVCSTVFERKTID